VGLREIQGLNKLHTIYLRDKEITDQVLRTLREIGLLHALSRAWAEDGRPTGPDDVIGLALEGTSVTNAGLPELRNFKRLERLDLHDTKITDTGFKELKGLDKLRSLRLDPGQTTLIGLKNLREIGLLHAWAGTEVNDEGMESLNLNGNDTTDQWLKELRVKELKGLKALFLANSRVTDEGLKELGELQSLQNIYLKGTKVTDAGVADLQKALPKLRISR
jgi:Leucine-rich repeat (LRR) protein